MTGRSACPGGDQGSVKSYNSDNDSDNDNDRMECVSGW